MTPKKTFFQRFKKLLIFTLVIGLSVLFFANWLGFQHIPGQNLWHEITNLSNLKKNFNDYASGAKSIGSVTDEADITDVVESAPVSPTDTVRLKKMELGLPELEQERVETLKYLRHHPFSNLTVAQEKPTSEQVQQALIRRYGDEMITLLQEHKAHVEVGNCFNAVRQKSESGALEAARVTCMVSAFNKKHENLGNIQLPLNIVYDFVRFEGESEWKVTDFSQTIPFDYQLNPSPKDEE